MSSNERIPTCPLTVSGECLVEKDFEKRQELVEEAESKLDRKKVTEIERLIVGSACNGCEYVKKVKARVSRNRK